MLQLPSAPDPRWFGVLFRAFFLGYGLLFPQLEPGLAILYNDHHRLPRLQLYRRNHSPDSPPLPSRVTPASNHGD
ncbi:hypothetical protein ACQ86N_36050 [Puia sp. P3]|uniref:hypothetical protein n=1 Tax=Puia sp. P3 TaxID=3423952 RepID=UPI003D6785F2